MKSTIAAVSIRYILSFGSFAADSINAEQAQNREAIGTVSVGSVSASQMDMKAMLQQQPEYHGAYAHRVIEVRQGDNSHAHADQCK